MRDSFPAIVAAMLTIATLCFTFAVMSLRGIRQRGRPAGIIAGEEDET